MKAPSAHLLISSCLLGQCCRWDARTSKSCLRSQLADLYASSSIIAFCPECAGGLSTPRAAAEIAPGSTAQTVLLGQGKVINTADEDVTQAYIQGALGALELVRQHNIEVAVLKSKSPACSSSLIYDGTFSSRLIEGNGVTAQLLKNNGVLVFDETQLEEALNAFHRLSHLHEFAR